MARVVAEAIALSDLRDLLPEAKEALKRLLSTAVSDEIRLSAVKLVVEQVLGRPMPKGVGAGATSAGMQWEDFVKMVDKARAEKNKPAGPAM